MSTKTSARRRVAIDRRQREVALLLLTKRASESEIQQALADDPETRNPETGKPWSIGTIHNDVEALRSQWRESSQVDSGLYFGEVLSELELLRATAWQNNDLQLVLNALKAKISLLGLNAPQRHEVTGSEGEPLFTDIDAYARFVEAASKTRDSELAEIDAIYSDMN
jgi:hypothetical protein